MHGTLKFIKDMHEYIYSHIIFHDIVDYHPDFDDEETG